MALPLASNAEGGTPAATVTTANSGGSSGNSFNEVAIGSGCTLTYATDQAAHGTLGYKLTNPATGAATYVAWTSVSIGVGPTTFYGRLYLRFAAAPSGSVRLIRILQGTTALGGIWITNARKIQAYTGTGTAAGTLSTTVIPLGAWVRIEFRFALSGASGTSQIRIFTTADSTAPTETINATANFGTAWNAIRWGSATGTASNWTWWLDDLQVNAIDFPGPAGGTPPVVIAKTGTIAAGTRTSGGDIRTLGRSGTVACAAQSSGVDIHGVATTGVATLATKTSGTDAYAVAKAGSTANSARVGGVDVFAAATSGAAIAFPVVAGRDFRENTKTGTPATAARALGPSSSLLAVIHDKAGTLAATVAAHGLDTHTSGRAGRVAAKTRIAGAAGGVETTPVLIPRWQVTPSPRWEPCWKAYT